MEAATCEYIAALVNGNSWNSSLFRTLACNWFAFRQGGPWLDGNNSGRWLNTKNLNDLEFREGLLPYFDFVSTGAQIVTDQRRCPTKPEPDRLVLDHSVPLSVIWRILRRDGQFAVLHPLDGAECSPHQVQEVLVRFYAIGLVTKSEDTRLYRDDFGGHEVPGGNDLIFWRYETPRDRGHAIVGTRNPLRSTALR